METKEIKNVDSFSPDDEDILIPKQVADILRYQLIYGNADFIFVNHAKIKENDIIVFMVKDPKEYDPTLCKETRTNEFHQFEGVRFKSVPCESPYFFITRYLYETSSHLYFWHRDRIKRVPLEWLDSDVWTVNEPYKKIVSINLSNEA